MMQRMLQMNNKYDFVKFFEDYFLCEKHIDKAYTVITVEFDNFDLLVEAVFNCIKKLFIEPYVNNILTFEGGFYDCSQKKTVYDEIFENVDFSEVKNVIAKISASNHVINLEGIFNFRLREWLIELREICGRICDNYVLASEYGDFITMLKFFASVNSGSTRVVNLMMKSPQSADILDENFEKADFSAGTLMSEYACFENIFEYDNIVSLLVEMSPEIINVHNWQKFKNCQMLETLSDIFDEKIVLCSGCKYCTEDK